MLQANHPFSLILFGASGHLARIKIFPALYYLALKKRFPSQYAIVGFARTEMTDAKFRELVTASIREHVPEVNDKVLSDLLTHITYRSGQYDSVADFRKLRDHLESLEGAVQDIVRLAYLSIPPSAFSATLENLCAGKIHPSTRSARSLRSHSGQAGQVNSSGNFRCIVEKPVGSNLKTFEEINAKLSKCFKANEIYMLDHYLGKEAVRNAYFLRHANPVIERLLKNTLISNVQVTASEVSGLEGRAGYFDSVGTLRDMFQSHLIQIGALLTMRLTSNLDDLKSVRLDAVRKFYLPPAADLGEIAVQGQYVAGEIGGKKVGPYSTEDGVAKKSRAPTYAAIKLMSRSSRWEGVPFFLRSGKRLKVKETRIAIEFQESPTLVGKGEARNRLDIILQGEAGMKLYLQTKLGGSDPSFRALVMEDPLVCMGDCLVEHSLLLLEAINGHQRWFLDPEEARAGWHLIDPLQAYFDKPSTPLALYPSGSSGPKEADDFIARFGHKWL